MRTPWDLSETLRTYRVDCPPMDGKWLSKALYMRETVVFEVCKNVALVSRFLVMAKHGVFDNHGILSKWCIMTLVPDMSTAFNQIRFALITYKHEEPKSDEQRLYISRRRFSLFCTD